MYKPKHDYRNSEMDALIAEWVHEEVERSPKCVKGRYKAAYTSLSRHF